MFTIENFETNKNVSITQRMGGMFVLEYIQNLSTTPEYAERSYFMSAMKIRKKQLVCDLKKSPVTIQAGSMMWMAGDVTSVTGVKGVATCLKKQLSHKYQDLKR